MSTTSAPTVAPRPKAASPHIEAAGARTEKVSSPRPPEGAPPGGRAREIEGFRGLAALSTVVFHVWQQYFRYDADGIHPPVDNPYLGAVISLEVIDLFFVMSAYLLTLSYARAAIDGGSVRPAGVFLFRRAIRIVPLYFLAVLLVWASRNPTLPGNWTDLVQHLTFTHVFSQEQIFYTLGPTWSLSLEMMFYLALVALGPVAVRACRSLRLRRSRIALCAGGCLLLFVVPVIWIAVAHYAYGIPHTEWPVYFGPQARFGGFAAGMGLAVAQIALGERGRMSTGPAIALRSAVLVALFLLSLISRPENALFTFFHPLAALLWVLLLFGTIHVRRQGRWHKALTARWLTGAGLVSYSLFIWHEPIMLQLYTSGLLPSGPGGYPLATLIVLAVAVPVAVASYWLIEYPSGLLGRLKDKSGKPRDFYAEAAR
ncbi:acyltransferase family protein [Streptomyces sp. NPDC048639]|uniref:acyltransferase family protein n=1 Tax=Streptomyces sp. NPDC048639 TaxID=3365581 RepID=UPI00371432B2